MEEKAYVVYTDKRGVFFGYTRQPFDREKMTFFRCRMCVSWRTGKGVLSLAAEGPSEKCRVTPPVPSQVLVDLHGASECTAEAVAAWERGPWG